MRLFLVGGRGGGGGYVFFWTIEDENIAQPERACREPNDKLTEITSISSNACTEFLADGDDEPNM